MTLERTLADLLDDVGDVSLVADALGAAVKKQSLDFYRLRELFGPLAERNGFKRHDGNAVLEQLLEVAGLDLDSIARRFSTDPVLSSKILDNYLKVAMTSIEMPDMGKLTQQLKPLMPEARADLAQRILEVINPQIAIDEKLWSSLTDAGSLQFDKTLLEFINTSAMASISRQWTKDFTALGADGGAGGAASVEREVEE